MGLWVDNLNQAGKAKVGMGSAASAQQWLCLQTNFFAMRKCEKEAGEKGGQHPSPHTLSFPRFTFMRNGNRWPPSFTLTPANSSSGLISSLLHILPQTWVYLLNRSNETDFVWWNVLRWSVSIYENGGFVFLINLHFLKITGNYFLKEIHNSLGKFLPLQSLLPCR